MKSTMSDADWELLIGGEPACGKCGAPMVLRKSAHGHFYGCTRWPECNGTHAAHQATGKPMGIPADDETRVLRRECHVEFDKVREMLHWSKRGLYIWLGRRLGLSREECHFGMMNKAQCEKALLILKGMQPS